MPIPAPPMTGPNAAALIRLLDLAPHPEGGHFRETFRDRPPGGGRGAVTCIHYLLASGEQSAWHRIDATEIWHFAAGDPLELRLREADGPPATLILGPDVLAGHSPHAVVRPFVWQSAASLGAWTLVSCVVAPAFRFDGFELAGPDGPLGQPIPTGG